MKKPGFYEKSRVFMKKPGFYEGVFFKHTESMRIQRHVRILK